MEILTQFPPFSLAYFILMLASAFSGVWAGVRRDWDRLPAFVIGAVLPALSLSYNFIICPFGYCIH